MKRTTPLLTIALAGLVFAGSTSAQDSPAPTDGAMEQAAQEFLQSKRMEQAARERRLQAAGRAAQLPQLRRLVAQSDFVRPTHSGQMSPATQSAIEESLIADAAQRLAASNLTPDRVAAYLRAGINPLDAAINLIRGTPSALDVAALSDRILIGTIQSVRDLPGGTELPSIVTLKVSQTLLGVPAETIAFEQFGNSASRFEHTLTEDVAAPVLVFLSDGSVKFSGRGPQGQAGTPELVVSPFVQDTQGRFVPLGLSVLRPIDLAQFAESLAPLTALRRAAS